MGERKQWLELADSLADRISEALLLGETADRWLPLKARPATPAGIAIWLRAENAYGTGEWEQADQRYRAAYSRDTTCFLCVYRSNDVDRWLGRGASPERSRWLVGHADKFPPHYQALIRANALPWPDRFDSLRAATVVYSDFALSWFAAGDEAFHRSPLHGGARRDALDFLIRATNLKPRFAPGWEHLAWLALGIGDSVMAARALDSLGNTPIGAGFSGALRTVLTLGFAWRFLPESQAKEATDRTFEIPSIRANKEVAGGPRVLMTMGSPNGALYFGRLFASDPGSRELAKPGLLAALYGATALGMIDTAAAIRHRLGLTDATSETLELFLAEWALVASELDGATDGGPARVQLAEIEKDSVWALPHRQRAAWLLGLTTSGSTTGADTQLVTGDLGTLLTAEAAARHGEFARAVALTDPIPTLDIREPVDPFLPLMLRIRRAAWLERGGHLEAARRELRSYEHLQYSGLPTGDPQAGEVDWAFGTAVAWRRVALLARIPAALGELCQVAGEVVRQWRRGAPLARARADSAARQREALGCVSGR